MEHTLENRLLSNHFTVKYFFNLTYEIKLILALTYHVKELANYFLDLMTLGNLWSQNHFITTLTQSMHFAL